MTTFGGALRYLSLSGDKLHDDEDPRVVSVLTDDERAAVFMEKEKTILHITIYCVSHLGKIICGNYY